MPSTKRERMPEGRGMSGRLGMTNLRVSNSE
jgi:hypothetical protein